MEQTDILNATNGLSSYGGLLSGFSLWGILASLVFSVVGLIYFKRGRREGNTNVLLCGLALMIYPYFVTNTILIVVVGAALSAIPYFL